MQLQFIYKKQAASNVKVKDLFATKLVLKKAN